MYKVILILDKFFLKYEGGSNWPQPQEKLPSKSPALLGLKSVYNFKPTSILIQYKHKKYKETIARNEKNTFKHGTIICAQLQNHAEFNKLL